QSVVRPFFNTRAFGDVLIEIARQMGGNVADALPWNSFKDMVRESAQALQGLGRGSVQSDNFETFWNGVLQRGVWYDLDARPQTSPPTPELPREPIRPAFQAAPGEEEFNLVLYPSLALTDGRGANLPWLQATPDPITTVVWGTWVDLSPDDARRLDIKANDIVEVRSVHNAIEAPVYVNPGAPPGTISIAVGQGHLGFGRYAEERGANPLSLLAPFTDGHTGALAWNATRVRVTKTTRERTLAKFEGTVIALPAPETELIQIQHKG
ncbi:MAG: molybdopterin dinucleotide binding domain-containing protein, partial [Dehalococcoidia bacterium]